MRLALLCATALISTPLSAATFIIKDTVDPVNGLVSIYNFSDANGLPYDPVRLFLADNSKMKVSLSINNGVIAEAYSYFPVLYAYDDYDFYDGYHVNSGEDYHFDELCRYNSGDVDGCHSLNMFDPTDPYGPPQLTSGFQVGTQTLSYTIFRPHSYDHCTPLSVGICSEFWDIGNEYDFTIFSHKPVSYTLKFTSLGKVAVPEPASWAMMIAGFGLVGRAMRKKRADRNKARVLTDFKLA